MIDDKQRWSVDQMHFVATLSRGSIRSLLTTTKQAAIVTHSAGTAKTPRLRSAKLVCKEQLHGLAWIGAGVRVD